MFKAYPIKDFTRQRNAELIYSECIKNGLTLDSQIAYAFANALVNKNLDSYKEVLAPVGTEKRAEQDAYWNSGYYGRGYAQLKWRANY